jgi:MtN3 and saliva related transmembrane protein
MFAGIIPYMNSITILGLCAGTITSAGFIPQLIKVTKTKHAGDVALLQPIILSIGIFLWFLYGLEKHDIAIIFANGFSLICNLILIGLKVRYS